MTTITVRGPMEDGLYHLGYKDGQGNFTLIQKFVDMKLACSMAGKMMRDREAGQPKDSANGKPSA